MPRGMFKSIFCLCLVLLVSVFGLTACDMQGGYNLDRAGRYIGVGDRVPLESAQTNQDIERQRLDSDQNTVRVGHKIKVAILLPLSGRHEKLGQAMLNAAQLALFNIAHDQFSLVPYDTAGTRDGASRAAEQAVADDVGLVLGPLFADSVRGAKPVIMNANLSMLAFTTDWSLAGQNTYLMGFLPFDQVNRIVSYAASRGIERIGIVAPDTDYGRIVSTIAREAAARHNVRITAETTLPNDGLNYGDPIREFVKPAGMQKNMLSYDAILLPIGGEGAIAASNLLTRYGAPPDVVQRLTTGVMDDPRLFGEQGLKGTWMAAPEPSLRVKFEQDYKSIYGQVPPRLATLAYDATALSAVLSQRSLTGKISAADIMNPNGFSGIDGVFRFRSNGVAERGLSILEMDNGRLVTLNAAPRTFRQ